MRNNHLLLAAIMLTTAACSAPPDPARTAQVVAIVQTGAQITCAFAPTAAAITDLYTKNPDVKTTEQAIALLCASVHPNVIVPAAIAPPTVAPPTVPTGG